MRGEKRSTGVAGANRAGRYADHLLVLRLAVTKFDSAVEQLRLAGCEARFRLSDVGAGDFAGVEAVAGLTQRNLEHVHVAALQLENRGVRSRFM